MTEAPKARRAVLLFARAPRVEAQLKGIGRGELLFRHVARHLAQASRAVGADLVVVGGVEGGLPQRGRGFGERLAHAFDDVFALGYAAVVAVGLDAPELSERELALAFAAVEAEHVALGPAADGGVYLLGMDPKRRAILRGVGWQRSSTFADLARAAPDKVVLRTLHDLDSAADLRVARRFADRTLSALLTAWFGPRRAPEAQASWALSAWMAGVRPTRGPPLLATE